jgi:hypothetical protein
VLVFERCPVRSKQYQEPRSIVQFPFSRPRVALTLRNKIPFPFVTTVDCAFRSGLGGRNKHLPRAGQTLFTFHGNNRISPYLAARRSSQDVMSFDPHRGRNCRRTCCENNTHQNDSCLHGLAKRCTTMGECINRDNCLKQFLCLRGAMSAEGRGLNHTGPPRAAKWGFDTVYQTATRSMGRLHRLRKMCRARRRPRGRLEFEWSRLVAGPGRPR